MSTDFKFPTIAMPLYETDMDVLKEFIMTENIESGISDQYLILYNFAVDCRFSKSIQPDLIIYLLPFYLKAVREHVLYNNKTAEQIYCAFNSALFSNRDQFIRAVGKGIYQSIFERYVEILMDKMEMRKSFYTLDWVSLFNTVIAFSKDNIIVLFHRIFEATPKIILSFFEYLSVLLFKESDNLLIKEASYWRWTESIWGFDTDALYEFFWNSDIIEYFTEKISREIIERLFSDIKPLLQTTHKAEEIELIAGEMRGSFVDGVFDSRKAEYLEKIKRRNEDMRYWYNY